MGLTETLATSDDPRLLSNDGVVEEIILTVLEGFEGRITDGTEVKPETGMRLIPSDSVILRPARDVEKYLHAIGETLQFEVDVRQGVPKGVPGADPDIDYVEFQQSRPRTSRKGTRINEKYRNGAHVTYGSGGTAYGTGTDPSRTVFVLAIKDVPDDQKTLDFTTVDGDSLTGIPISKGDVFDDWLIDTYTVNDPNTTGGDTNVLEARE